MNLITGPGQLQYRGYVLGDEVNTFVDSVTGWDDLPGIDNANTLRPSEHGAWSGRKLATQRIITWEGRFAPSPETWDSELQRLIAATAVPVATEEYEIAVRLHGDTSVAFGAITGRALPAGREYGYYGANLTIQFTCSDPRKYSTGEHVWTLYLPPFVTSGLSYPLSYDLDYGDSQDFSSATLVNDGNVLTPAVYEFSGEMVNPILINSTTGLRLGFNITLTASDTLTVDTKNGTVLLNGTADRLYTRMLTSAPISSFGLASGNNTFQIVASSWTDPAGVSITWRDATL